MSALAPDLPASLLRCDTHTAPAGGNHLPQGHSETDAQADRAPRNGQHDALLLVLADHLDDLEAQRIATANRLRALVTDKGMAGTAPAVRLAALLDHLAALEHQAALDLRRAMRTHPLAGWVAVTVGVGERQAARLLAAIGWPTAGRPNPAKLWQYCGHGDPARSRRQRGARIAYSPTAKVRTRLIAESCMKQRSSPYRAVYDAERERWADRETTDAHKHSHALRVVGKRVLLDLWREAHRIDLEATA
ncbi:hypothetical protein [Patulibacter defluvii]|uniref:hypothetical protein n=1 Tax=Patulibacter defluvii TaxID=3095358 RepID=UPI002A761F48|nr:hypothetical protein [Patulibacter sp. DM4]